MQEALKCATSHFAVKKKKKKRMMARQVRATEASWERTGTKTLGPYLLIFFLNHVTC